MPPVFITAVPGDSFNYRIAVATLALYLSPS